jgi:hypothetical protein
MEHIGRESAVGVAIEGTRGVAETAASKWFKKTSATLLPEVTKIIDDSSFGRLEDAEEARTVREWFEGDVNGVLHADAIGYYLSQMYGEVATTTVTGAVRQHVFTLAQDITHPTLSMFVSDPVKNEVYNGGVVSSLTIEANTDDYVRYTANVLARSSGTHTDTVELGTEYDFIGKDIIIKMADTFGGLAGAAVVPVKTLNIEYDTGAISDWVFGSTAPTHYNGAFGITFTLSKNYTNTDFETLYKNNAAKYVSISIKGGNVLAGSNAPELTFTFYKAKVTEYDIDDASNDLREENITFKALYNTTDQKQSQVLLRNVTDEYITGS